MLPPQSSWSLLVQALHQPFFIPLNQVPKHFGRVNFSYNSVQEEFLIATLPSTKVRHWCVRNDYVLLPPPPRAYTLHKLHRRFERYFAPGPIIGADLRYEGFARVDRVLPTWIRLSATPLSGSWGKTWREQCVLLPSPFTMVPTAATVVWAMVAMWRVHKRRLLDEVWVRTRSVNPARGRLCVSMQNGLITFAYAFDHERRPDLGIAPLLPLTNDR